VGQSVEDVLERLDLTPMTAQSKPSRKEATDMRSFMRLCSKEYTKSLEF